MFQENHDELCDALWKDLRRNVIDADLMDVDAQAGGACGDRGHEHVARTPGVLADDDRAAGRTEMLRGGASERVREGRLEIDVGDPADAVGTEESGHLVSASAGDRRERPRPRAV